jgi:hypothetical protein
VKVTDIPLVNLSLPAASAPLPEDIRSFIREAERRIEEFQIDSRFPGFVPSDFASAYGILRALADADGRRARLFCEWGSGFGVVACLAAMLDFEASGIEVEGELVEAARQLADDFEVPVEFVHGSFIPAEASGFLKSNDGFAWLTPSTVLEFSGDLAPEDFDVIFAYPWPDEALFIETLFERHAKPGALFVTYHGGEEWQVRRLAGAKKRKRPHRRRQF